MKLLHSTCQAEVDITTERIAVRILEVAVTDANNLEETLLDLVPMRSGKILFYCPHCKEEVDPKTGLSLSCTRCGNLIPITRIFTLKPTWGVLCENCYIVAYKRENPDVIEVELNPIQLKLK